MSERENSTTAFTQSEHPQALISLSIYEAKIADTIFERMFPADATAPGAHAIGVVHYLDRALDGAYHHLAEIYHLGLAGLNENARLRHGTDFISCTDDQQNALLSALESGTLAAWEQSQQIAFFALLRAHLQEGLFADPIYGGNRNKQGWATLGHPGVWLENSAEENLSGQAVTKDGVIQSMTDVGYNLGTPTEPPALPPGYQPNAPKKAVKDADIILVGLGAVGGLVAQVFTEAGLQVVAFEAGPYYSKRDFIPDELGATYYCRANLGRKFLQEVPRWRRNSADPTEEATFSLGRMVNGVGGSAIHYGAWLRRFHPHHFSPRSRVRERWGDAVLPEECTLVDWPLCYADLEPYYDRLDQLIGIAGPDVVPFIPRRQPHPMPPLRPFRLGEFFTKATKEMGLQPYPVPVGINSVPYDQRPALTYTAWSNGFGSYNDAKWQPGLTSVPKALATGNLTLRTHCRVIRILTDENGHADGVEFIDNAGQLQQQRARTVILSSYTFENIRLLLLSGDHHHPNGLGNNFGQVGQNFMTKMFAHVDGYFPNIIFNRHTGPAAQGVIVDDYLADAFDSWRYGFIGGATLGAEQQFLPIQISREALPSDVPTWGAGYKEHLRQWQHFGVVRIQPDTLPYRTNYIDLDPRYRDRSGLGLPVVRITYDMRENEQQLANWMEGKAEEILQKMGAQKTWRGPRFTGIGSSHDLGGCRFGTDPTISVLDPSLQVHDTPGLYLFGGAAFPSCPGINPTLTIWALALRAAESLVMYLSE